MNNVADNSLYFKIGSSSYGFSTTVYDANVTTATALISGSGKLRFQSTESFSHKQYTDKVNVTLSDVTATGGKFKMTATWSTPKFNITCGGTTESSVAVGTEKTFNNVSLVAGTNANSITVTTGTGASAERETFTYTVGRAGTYNVKVKMEWKNNKYEATITPTIIVKDNNGTPITGTTVSASDGLYFNIDGTPYYFPEALYENTVTTATNLSTTSENGLHWQSKPSFDHEYYFSVAPTTVTLSDLNTTSPKFTLTGGTAKKPTFNVSINGTDFEAFTGAGSKEKVVNLTAGTHTVTFTIPGSSAPASAPGMQRAAGQETRTATVTVSTDGAYKVKATTTWSGSTYNVSATATKVDYGFAYIKGDNFGGWEYDGGRQMEGDGAGKFTYTYTHTGNSGDVYFRFYASYLHSENQVGPAKSNWLLHADAAATSLTGDAYSTNPGTNAYYFNASAGQYKITLDVANKTLKVERVVPTVTGIELYCRYNNDKAGTFNPNIARTEWTISSIKVNTTNSSNNKEDNKNANYYLKVTYSDGTEKYKTVGNAGNGAMHYWISKNANNDLIDTSAPNGSDWGNNFCFVMSGDEETISITVTGTVNDVSKLKFGDSLIPNYDNVNMDLTPASFKNGQKHYFLVGTRTADWRLQPEWELRNQSGNVYTLPDARLLYSGAYGIAEVSTFDDYVHQRYKFYSIYGDETVSKPTATFSKTISVRYDEVKTREDIKGVFKNHGILLKTGDSQGNDEMHANPIYVSSISFNTSNGVLTFNGATTDQDKVNEELTFSIVGGSIGYKDFADEFPGVAVNTGRNSSSNIENNWQESWIQFKDGKPMVDGTGTLVYQTVFQNNWLGNHPTKFRKKLDDGSYFTYESTNLLMRRLTDEEIASDEYRGLYIQAIHNNGFDGEITVPLFENGIETGTNTFPESLKLKNGDLDADKSYNNTLIPYVVENMWLNGAFKIWTGWSGNNKDAEGWGGGTSLDGGDDVDAARWYYQNGGHTTANKGYSVKGYDVLYDNKNVCVYGTRRDVNGANFVSGYKVNGYLVDNDATLAENPDDPTPTTVNTYYKRVILWYDPANGFDGSVLQLISESYGVNIVAQRTDATHLKYTWDIPEFVGMDKTGELDTYTVERYRFNEETGKYELMRSFDAVNLRAYDHDGDERTDPVQMTVGDVCGGKQITVNDPYDLPAGSYEYKITLTFKDGSVRTAWSNPVSVVVNTVSPIAIAKQRTKKSGSSTLYSMDYQIDLSVSSSNLGKVVDDVEGTVLADCLTSYRVTATNADAQKLGGAYVLSAYEGFGDNLGATVPSRTYIWQTLDPNHKYIDVAPTDFGKVFSIVFDNVVPETDITVSVTLNHTTPSGSVLNITPATATASMSIPSPTVSTTALKFADGTPGQPYYTTRGATDNTIMPLGAGAGWDVNGDHSNGGVNVTARTVYDPVHYSTANYLYTDVTLTKMPLTESVYKAFDVEYQVCVPQLKDAAKNDIPIPVGAIESGNILEGRLEYLPLTRVGGNAIVYKNHEFDGKNLVLMGFDAENANKVVYQVYGQGLLKGKTGWDTGITGNTYDSSISPLSKPISMPLNGLPKPKVTKQGVMILPRCISDGYSEEEKADGNSYCDAVFSFKFEEEWNGPGEKPRLYAAPGIYLTTTEGKDASGNIQDRNRTEIFADMGVNVADKIANSHWLVDETQFFGGKIVGETLGKRMPDMFKLNGYVNFTETVEGGVFTGHSYEWDEENEDWVYTENVDYDNEKHNWAYISINKQEGLLPIYLSHVYVSNTRETKATVEAAVQEKIDKVAVLHTCNYPTVQVRANEAPNWISKSAIATRASEIQSAKEEAEAQDEAQGLNARARRAIPRYILDEEAPADPDDDYTKREIVNFTSSAKPLVSEVPEATGYFVTTGVDPVVYTQDFTGDEVIYNLQGIRVVNPEPGNVYIFVNGNSATKVLVK